MKKEVAETVIIIWILVALGSVCFVAGKCFERSRAAREAAQEKHLTAVVEQLRADIDAAAKAVPPPPAEEFEQSDDGS